MIINRHTCDTCGVPQDVDYTMYDIGDVVRCNLPNCNGIVLNLAIGGTPTPSFSSKNSTIHEELHKLKEENTRITNELVEANFILENIMAVLIGQEISSYAASFGIIGLIQDLRFKAGEDNE